MTKRITITFVFVMLISPIVASAFNAQGVSADPGVLEFDRDMNRIADALEDSAAVLVAKGEGDCPLPVIVLLEDTFEKQDSDLFQKYGGTISHRFHRVIQGFSGTIPPSSISPMVAGWGHRLSLIDLDHQLTLAMDTTVPQTRARPLVWETDPNGYGLQGDSGTTIAILDTGIDFTHPDLAGKSVFWHDFHPDDGYEDPVDYNCHGSFVAGIACGTGAVGGNEPRDELTYTVWYSFGHYAYPDRLGTWIPTVGDGQVQMDMIWDSPWSPRDACFGFGPLDGEMDGPFCDNGPSLVHSFSISEAGYYLLYFIDSFDLQGNESSTLITTPYEHPGDGFNLFQGMAPGCNLAGFKVFNANAEGTDWSSSSIAGMDSLAGCNSQYDIKVANFSAGSPGSIALRNAASGVVTAGTVLVGVAHNHFPNVIGDPGNSPLIITVGAVNDHGLLTNYTSRGHPAMPIKPDVLAPGGGGPAPLGRGAGVMGIDTNFSDGSYWFIYPDRVPNDYQNNGWGTSWAAPHVAGLAALVIQALERTGYVWNYTLEDALLVKSIILMTATETNLPREESDFDLDPTLDRGGKDRQEGYGMINADAAVEAVLKSWPTSDRYHPIPITFGSEPADRRCWAAALSDEADTIYVDLAVPITLDADVYIYKANFDDGDPDLVASSINVNEGDDESLVFVPDPGVQYYLTVKRISGFGETTLGFWYSPVNEQDILKTHLVGNYPNPFNPRTTIKFSVGQQERVNVSVYDIAGRQVAVLEDRVFKAGLQEVTWDGSDSRGTAVASGSYFVRMKSATGEEQKKIMLVR